MNLGKQIIVELYDCKSDLLSNPEMINEIMCAAAEAMKATIVTSTFHHFSPLGVSGVVVIKESHLTIHTWPEFSYAAVDIFTCGDIDMNKGLNYLQEKLEAQSVESKELIRGERLILSPKN